MGKYKLGCGLEFDVKPAGLGPETDGLLALIDKPPENVKEYARSMFRCILAACCDPEVAEKATLVDSMQLDIAAMQDDAMPGLFVRDESEPKNAEGLAASENGCGPESKAEGLTQTDSPSPNPTE